MINQISSQKIIQVKMLMDNLLNLYYVYTVDLVILEVLIFVNFARRTNYQIQESSKNANIIALPQKNVNSQILSFMKSSKIINSLEFKHTKIIRSTVSLQRYIPKNLNFHPLEVATILRPTTSSGKNLEKLKKQASVFQINLLFFTIIKLCKTGIEDENY